jgi:hypothetical protein
MLNLLHGHGDFQLTTFPIGYTQATTQLPV